MFASELFHIDPDIIVLGKAIAAGMPLSAIVGRKEIMEAWHTPVHFFSTLRATRFPVRQQPHPLR